MPKSIILGVAGLQGSGKTTLARGLATRLGWEFVAESATAKRYIPELFVAMRQLAFEAQIGFLCNKAIAIQDRLFDGIPIVVDRTLYEDWHVFARYFRNIEMMDERAFSTYAALADYFTSIVPAPVLTLFCDCPVTIAKQRIDDRKRESQKHYPENHMEDIAALYATWFHNYSEGPLAQIDSVTHDFREENIVQAIADEVMTLLTSPTSNEQLDLFVGITRKARIATPTLVKPVRGVESVSALAGEWRRSAKPPSARLPDVPFAYLAAPFTEFTASDAPQPENSLYELLPSPAPHGTIPAGQYRKALQGLERGLMKYNLQTLIPHRDVNEWGRKTVLAADVFAHCTLAVQKADLVVAILGHSPGAHFEVGLAQGLGKPVLAIQCSEIPTSYLAMGMSFVPHRTLICKCEQVSDIPSVLARLNVETFLKTAVLI